MNQRRNINWRGPGSIVAVFLVSGVLLAQEQPKPQGSSAPGPTTLDYSTSRSFPNILGPYMPRLVPQPSMSNSERVHSLMREGKLYLSISEAVALALENNLDIAIARYTPAYAQTDVLRAKSGGATRGIAGAFQSTALFGGALGGGVAGGGGGGGGGAGGAFGGGGAINTGSVGSFDPVTGFNFGWDRRTTPLGITLLQGVPFVTTQTTTMSGFLGQRFLTGTSLVLALNGDRQSTTSLTSVFNPQVPTGMTIGLNQPFLRGFGYRANAQFIRISKNNLRFADSSFRQQVIIAVTQIANLYWDLVSFRENVRVANQALALAQKTLSDNKRQVEIGTLAPIEVVRAESEVAARQQDLIVAQTNAQQQQEILKTAVSKQVDAALAAAEIIPTDALPQPKADDIPPLDEALHEAAQNRPEIEQADLNIRNQEITIQSSRNALLPALDAFATYAPQGLSGHALCGGDPRFQPPCPAGVTGFIPGGVSQSFTQTFQGRYPDYSFGMTLQIPIRNRSAQADAARALLEERNLRTQLQKTKNQVAQDVRNAEIAVIQAKAQIEAARKAVVLARETLDAEQKKFQLGESTVFQVIQAQRDLATQQGNEVRARSTYAKALTQFAQATGTTLQKNNIELEEAKEGRVSHPPNIPGTPPTPATQGN